jgi:hypothetical protein
MVASHRFPSEALQRASDLRIPALRARAVRLRSRVNGALVDRARAGGRADLELRARTAFGLLGDLSSQTVYELIDEAERDRMQRHLLKLAAIELA